MPICISSLRLFFASSTAAVLFSKFEPTLASHARKDETKHDDLKGGPLSPGRTSRDAKWIRDEKLLGTRVVSQDRPLNSETHKQGIASAFDASAPATERLRNMSPPHQNVIKGRSCDPDVGVLSCGDGEDCRRDPSQVQGGVCVPRIGVAQEEHRRLGIDYGTVGCGEGDIRLDVYITADFWSSSENRWNVTNSGGNEVVAERGFPSPPADSPFFYPPVNGYFCVPVPEEDGYALTLNLFDSSGNGIFSRPFDPYGLQWSQNGEPIVSFCNTFFDMNYGDIENDFTKFQTCIEFDADQVKFRPCDSNIDPCLDTGYGTIDCDADGAIRLDVYIMADDFSRCGGEENTWKVEDSNGFSVVETRRFPFCVPVNGHFCVDAPQEGDALTLTLYDANANGIGDSFFFFGFPYGFSWAQYGEPDPIVSLCDTFFDSDKFQTCIKFDGVKFVPCEGNYDPCFERCMECPAVKANKATICQYGITRQVLTKALDKPCSAGATCGECRSCRAQDCPPDKLGKVTTCQEGRTRLVTIGAWEKLCATGEASCGPCSSSCINSCLPDSTNNSKLVTICLDGTTLRVKIEEWERLCAIDGVSCGACP